MIDFIEEHRSEHGVEPICEVLPIAPATYYAHRAKRLDPSKRSVRAKRDDELRPEIRPAWSVWRRMCRWPHLLCPGRDARPSHAIKRDVTRRSGERQHPLVVC